MTRGRYIIVTLCLSPRLPLDLPKRLSNENNVKPAYVSHRATWTAIFAGVWDGNRSIPPATPVVVPGASETIRRRDVGAESSGRFVGDELGRYVELRSGRKRKLVIQPLVPIDAKFLVFSSELERIN